MERFDDYVEQSLYDLEDIYTFTLLTNLNYLLESPAQCFFLRYAENLGNLHIM
jgi:hypothetical protein